MTDQRKMAYINELKAENEQLRQAILDICYEDDGMVFNSYTEVYNLAEENSILLRVHKEQK